MENERELEKLKEEAKKLTKNNIWNEDAIKINEKILEFDNLYIESYSRLGKCYMIREDSHLAQLAYEEVMRLALKDSLGYKIALKNIKKVYNVNRVVEKYKFFYDLAFSKKKEIINNLYNTKELPEYSYINSIIEDNDEHNFDEFFDIFFNPSKVKIKEGNKLTIYYLNEYVPRNRVDIIQDKYNGGYILGVKNCANAAVDYYANKLINIILKNEQMNKASIVTCVPSSNAYKVNSGMLSLANKISRQICNLKYLKLLNRKYDVPKKAFGGSRDCKIEFDSIEIINHIEGNRDSTVLLLDDITTTGVSMVSATKILEDKGYNVIKIALGKTIPVYNEHKYIRNEWNYISYEELS